MQFRNKRILLLVGLFLFLPVFCVQNSQTTKREFLLSIDVHPSSSRIVLDGRTNKKVKEMLVAQGFHSLCIILSNYKNDVRSMDIQTNTSLFIRMVPAKSMHTFRRIVRCGGGPKDVTCSPDGKYMIISLLCGQGIDIYGVKEGKIVKRVRPPEVSEKSGYVEGVYKKDSSQFWFAQMETGNVYVLNMSNMKVIQTIKNVGDWTKVIEFSPDERLGYASNWVGNDIAVIDTQTYKIIRRFKVPGKSPRNMIITPDGKYLYIVCFDSGDLVKFDAKTGHVVSKLHTGGTLDRVRMNNEGNLLYFDNMTYNYLYEYDISTDKILRTVEVGHNPNNVRLTPDNKYIYVACRGPNNPVNYTWPSPENGEIYLVEVKSFKVVDKFGGGNQCVGLTITPDGKTIAFSDLQDAMIELYSAERSEVK